MTDTAQPTPEPTLPPEGSFAAKLRLAIEAAGLSQIKAGALLGVSALTISNWRKGRPLGGSEPSPQRQRAVLRKLAEAAEGPPKTDAVPVPTGRRYDSVDDMLAGKTEEEWREIEKAEGVEPVPYTADQQEVDEAAAARAAADPLSAGTTLPPGYSWPTPEASQTPPEPPRIDDPVPARAEVAPVAVAQPEAKGWAWWSRKVAL